MNLLIQNHNHFTTARDNLFRGTGERNQGYALLMMAKIALYKALIFSLLASHNGISSYAYEQGVHNFETTYY